MGIIEGADGPTLVMVVGVLNHGQVVGEILEMEGITETGNDMIS